MPAIPLSFPHSRRFLARAIKIGPAGSLPGDEVVSAQRTAGRHDEVFELALVVAMGRVTLPRFAGPFFVLEVRHMKGHDSVLFVGIGK
jgi:hypothetical protein